MPDKLYLFANNNEGTAENLGSYRLYNMKIDGGSEGVESGVGYVDCLIGDGNSYIDTGIIPTNGYTIDIEFMVYKRTDGNGEALYGNEHQWGISYSDGIALEDYYYSSYEQYLKWIDDRKATDINRSGGNIIYDKGSHVNKRLTYSHTIKNITSTHTLGLFATHSLYNTTHYYKGAFTGRIYDFKIYNVEGILIQHLRPCLDTEGVPCMYDEVSKQYFYNQGTGTFGYKKKLRDFQPVLDSNGIPTLMDKVNKKYYYDKNGKGFRYEESYKPVSYLRSDGYSWINTGIIPTTNTKVVVDTYMLLSDLNNGPALFGSTQTFLSFTFQTTVSWLYVGKINGKHSVGLAGHDFTGRHTITIDLSDMTNIVNIDGTNYGTFTGTQATDSKSIYLWNMFDSWGALGNSGGTAKIYSFKIYENNVLTMDLIPVLDNDGTPCMYDLVTKTFFYNQGTGEFSYGAVEELECPKANYVEYISSYEGGFRRIPLDFSLYSYNDTNMSYEYKATFNQKDNVSMPIGTIRVATDKQIPIYFYRGASRNLQIRCGNVNVQEFNFANANAGNTYVLSYNTQGNQEILANGKNVGTLDITGTMKSTDNLVLFDDTGVNSWTNANRYWQGDFYYFKMWYNGNLIHEILPCLDDNGEVAVYDTVTNKLYQQQVIQSNNIPLTSVGSSYTPIKYIETNGTQYIDTGVVPTDNTDIDMVARAVDKEYTQVEYLQGDGACYIPTGLTVTGTAGYDIEIKCEHGNSNSVIFGETSRTDISNSTKNFGLLWRNDLGWFVYGNFESSNNTDNVHILTKNIFVDNGYTPTFDNISMFGNTDGTFCSNSKIYYVKMFDTNDNLVNHFIPVLDSDNTPCMYDKVTQTYLYNQGTGIFSYGNVTPSKNYLMNDFYTDTTYKYKETNTNVEPNLTASDGATLTLGSTYMAYLTEDEIEQAINNGWTIE